MAEPVEVLCVDINAPGVVVDGVSWSTAFQRLQDALAIAVAGTEVRVADGVYRPDGGSGDRTATFDIPNGVTVLGSFAGFGAPNPNARNIYAYSTILDGDIGAPGDSTDNSFHVVRLEGGGPGTVISGCTIRGGRADGLYPDDRGGGLVVSSGSPLVEDCKVTLNHASTGGGLYSASGAAPTILGCTFLANSSTGNGGALVSIAASPVFLNCTLINNAADVSGGAVFLFAGTPQWLGCHFSGNSSTIFGGAVYSFSADATFVDCSFQQNIQSNNVNVTLDGGAAVHHDGGAISMQGCEFVDNLAGDDGGAMLTAAGQAILERCLFRGNWSGNRGGAIFSNNTTLELRSCLLNANIATTGGGAVHNVAGTPILRRSTLLNNRAIGLGGGMNSSGATIQIDSTLLWGNLDNGGTNEASQLRLTSGVADVRNTCLQGWTGGFGGVGNIPGPAMLVDADGADDIPGTADDDPRLAPMSPCVNTGDPDLDNPPEPADFAGQFRIQGCRVDIGAVEFVTGPPHSGDLDGSGFIDGHDVRLFTAALMGTGPAAHICVADLDEDEDVDMEDLPIFIDLCLSE